MYKRQIYDCQNNLARGGVEDVLLRIPVLETLTTRGSKAMKDEYGIETIYVEGDSHRLLTGYPSPKPRYGLGKLMMKGWDTVTITIDMRTVDYNMTYNEHYRLAVYAGCSPCPTRYLCDGRHFPVQNCSFPPEDEQKRVGVLCSDCCSCRPKPMPEFFVDNGQQQEVKLGYSYAPRNDNKHVMVQTSITAIKELNVTVALELLHGLYWKEFQDVTPDLFDAVFFAPCLLYTSPSPRD